MTPVNKRKIVVCILLSIVTLGIYQIYWEYLLVKNIRAIQKDETSCTNEMLCLVFIPFYSLYWWFTRGKIVKNKFAEHGYSAVGNEIAYLILGIFGLAIVSMAIMQNDFNSLKSESIQSIQGSPNKIGALIGNEILKLRRRKILLVMLIVLLVVCLGYQFLMGTLLDSLTDVLYGETEASLHESAESMLQELNKRGGENAPIQYDRQEWFYYTAILEYGIERDDWRFASDLLSDWAAAKAQNLSEADDLKALLDQNDYKAYYRYLISKNEFFLLNSKLADAKNWGYRYCIEHEILPNQGEWHYEMAMSAATANLQLCSFDLRKEITGVATDPALYEETLNAFELAKYQLDHDIEVNPADSFKQNQLVGAVLGNGQNTSKFWNAIASTSGITLVGLFMIIIAGGMVAGEFQKGTIKFLLLVPAKRWKILLAKYCAVLITGVFFLLIAWVANFLFCMMFQGVKDAFLPALSVKNGVVSTSSPYLLLIGRGLLSSVRVVVTATLAFAISSLLRNSAAAVGVSMLVLYGGSTITSILLVLGQDWARYLIFANLDLVAVYDRTTGFAHQSMIGAIIVVILHMIVFLWTAFDSFTRREI